MNTILDGDVREALKARVAKLTPDAQPLWGQMTVAVMVRHLGDQLRLTLGDIPPVPVRPGMMRFAPMKQVAVYWMPWPRGKIKVPIRSRPPPPEEWEDDLRALVELIDRFEGVDDRGDWPDHPLFGKMSQRLWCVLSARHLDHHLTQFGV